MPDRNIIAVVSASTADTHQQEILRGMTTAIVQNGMNVLLLSNLSRQAAVNALFSENEIYSLTLSPDITGVIFLKDQFSDPKAMQGLTALRRIRKSLPMIVFSRYPESTNEMHAGCKYCFIHEKIPDHTAGMYTAQMLIQEMTGNYFPSAEPPNDCRPPAMFMTAEEYQQMLDRTSAMMQAYSTCRNLNELIPVIRNTVRCIAGAEEIFLCLREDWTETKVKSESLSVISLISSQYSYYSCRIHELEFLFPQTGKGIIRCVPLYFNNQNFGYAAVRYDGTAFLTPLFIEWVRILSASLEIIRMKNDISCLLLNFHTALEADPKTGLYNENGMHHVFRILSAENTDFWCFAVQCRPSVKKIEFEITKKNSVMFLEVAEMIRKCLPEDAVCGCFRDGTMAIFTKSDTDYREMLYNIILNQTAYIQTYGIDSFFVCSVRTKAGESFSELKLRIRRELTSQSAKQTVYPESSYCHQLRKIRTEIYLHPDSPESPKEISRRIGISEGHFRMLYKNHTGINYHQDCINARISRAKYLLCTTDGSLTKIAELCGYSDEKFFIRQFKAMTGISPVRFRKQFMR